MSRFTIKVIPVSFYVFQMSYFRNFYDEDRFISREWRPYLQRGRLPGRHYHVQTVVSRPTRYAVIGASHVRRIEEHLQKKHIVNFGLNFRHYDLVCFGEGGLRACPDDKTPDRKMLGNHLDYAATVQADIVFIMAGSNDVMEEGISPQNIANALYGAAEYCLVAGAKRVVICLLFPRLDKAFNVQRNLVNCAIRRVVRLSGDGRIRYWHQLGLWGKPSTFICNDGTHLNKRGQNKLYRSLRGCAMKNYIPMRFR